MDMCHMLLPMVGGHVVSARITLAKFFIKQYPIMFSGEVSRVNPAREKPWRIASNPTPQTKVDEDNPPSFVLRNVVPAYVAVTEACRMKSFKCVVDVRPS